MTATLTPAKAGYLDRVRAALGDLPDDERDEVIQDLEAHLAELGDTEVERVLGTPEGFADEFRASAGLTDGGGRMSTVSDWLRRQEDRVTGSALWQWTVSSWQSVRPAWIWTRGWLLVSLYAAFAYGADSFRTFPVPSVASSGRVGAVMVAIATWVSVMLARAPARSWQGFASASYSAFTGLLLAVLLVNPVGPPIDYSFQEIPMPGLTFEGEPVRNIYAYDLDGNPVQVLLYDQDGRPLLNFATYTYGGLDTGPAQDRYPTDYGEVRFERDAYGRIIPNLYPLQTWEYSDAGLSPTSPPSLGFPTTEEPTPTDRSSPSTTVVPGRLPVQ